MLGLTRSKWRGFLSSARFSGASPAPRMMTSNDRRLADRATVYQRQISKWAQDREKVHNAASRHASWLSGLCDEVKEYSASRLGESAFASAAEASE